MPSNVFKIGPCQVAVSVDAAVSLPSLQTLVMDVSGATPTDILVNDVNRPLSASITYQVVIGLVGRDETNGGYTVGYCSPSSGDLTITSGQGIRVHVANNAWPADFNKAICAAIFLKEGNSDFKLTEFAYIDSSTDFNHMIKARPIVGVPEFTYALLRSTTADDVLGDRLGKGVTYRTLTPKTGATTITRETSQVTIDADTGPAFTVTTARTSSIAFQLLPNDIKDVIAGNAGIYASYSNGGLDIREGQMTINTAAAIITGNKPVKLILPPDNQGVQEVRLYLGLLTQNQSGNTESWAKDATTPIGYNFSTASLDKLTNGLHTEVMYRSRQA